MFFTHLGRVAAVLIMLAGVTHIALGLLIATETIGPYADALARYAPSRRSSGELIDRGIYTVLVGIALGALTDIGYALRRRTP
jgi:hypothetical protein